MESVQDRFWAKVRVGGTDECWEWTGALAGVVGHGHLRVGKTYTTAHRLAYLWAHHLDALPSGVYVRHRCKSPRCVNPAHLGTDTVVAPKPPKITRPRAEIVRERFWAKVQVAGPDDCWLWQGALAGKARHGHVGVAVDGGRRRYMPAHRLAYFWAHGIESLPSNILICHHCDQPRCVNPAHLFKGTQKDNMADCARKGRLAPPLRWPECIEHQAALKAAREERKRQAK